MKTSVPGPRVPSPFIKGLLSAFVRRRKAIKYQLETFEPSFGIEEDEKGSELQLLQVEAATAEGPPTQISLKVWEHGEMWFRLCKPGASRIGGWVFNESFRGTAANLEGRKLVKLYEESLLAAFAPRDGAELRERILKIWTGYIC